MKKNNTLLIIIVLVLAIIVVSIGIGLSVFNKTKTDSNGQQSITNNKDTVDVKVDLEKASNKLTEYFALYLKTNTTDSNLNKNLMATADNRLEIIDDYFMSYPLMIINLCISILILIKINIKRYMVV